MLVDIYSNSKSILNNSQIEGVNIVQSKVDMREAYVENGDMEISNIIKNSNMDNSDIAQGTLSIVDTQR